MAQAVKRRHERERARRSGSNVLSLLVVVVLLLGGVGYLFPALTSGDWLWFSTTFDAQPRQITVIDRGQRTTIAPSDARFAALAAAFNESITRGYRAGSLGFSEATQQVIDRNGLLVEMEYAEPVKLHLRGGFEPTTRLRLLVSGKDIHTTQALFRSGAQDWDTIPTLLNDVAPLQQVLSSQGFGA